jgi:hypothetical protein
MVYLGYVDNISFRRLPFIEICCIGKDIDGFVKVDFFYQKSIYSICAAILDS